ncbi:hypothetical protein HC251_11300 [Iamia sp. SCSIO 61187]|uniref:hypothetical protein n=1 Tax=Iamia sp. SCSIO 61187 TaxID=2722752 RepID=UPI001C628299|nr:hypothetical protein [Iamia sp. SCSIO 61187]QYG92957.1 hypothetical protein HC251_11300 [Iamia sp. SCSIO 61187]
MDPSVICAVLLVVIVAVGALLRRRSRARSHQRLQWQGTSERDWTIEELDALRADAV